VKYNLEIETDMRSPLTTAAILVTAWFGARAVAPSPQGTTLGEWRRLEGYGMLVERGPLDGKVETRELYIFTRLFHGRIPSPELFALCVDVPTGNVVSAYNIEMRESTRQPVHLTPMAMRLDANKTSFRVESEGDPVDLSKIESPTADGAAATPAAFTFVRAPAANGSALLPYLLPAIANGEPQSGARGALLEFTKNGWQSRPLVQECRRDESGRLRADFRSEGGAPFIINLQFSPQFPLPLWGQALDTARREQTRFRLVYHTPTIARALSLGRGPIAGDPLLVNPELLVNAESEWHSGVRDLVADELISRFAAERNWLPLAPRRSPSIGEVVPFGYELFAVNKSVKTGVTQAPAGNKPAASPRGSVGLVFAGRFEAPDTRIRYEAWILPGSDEREQEMDAPNALGESTGRLMMRLLLGNATSRLLADRGFTLRLDHGWFGGALQRGDAPPAPKAPSRRQRGRPNVPPEVRTPLPHGSDAVLFRREGDLAPVALVFYRTSSDLRAAVPFSRTELDGTGSASVVRRSLLERTKDFFLAGGFTAFTTKKGSSVLLTRSPSEGTVVDRLSDRGCTIEFLEETTLPEEPWTLAFDPKGARNTLWGTALPLAVGRNLHGDSRAARDGIVRRTDGEELIAYEFWESDRPWWSEGFVIYPEQNFGVRFRPLVHSRVQDPDATDNNNDNDGVLPFDPPPPPPQPLGNPKTPRNNSPPKSKPKPESNKPEPRKPPAPAPAPGTGPKTGG
jgi:hypothetical protein